MTRLELEHAIRASCDVAGDDEVYVFGSQASGRFEETKLETTGSTPRQSHGLTRCSSFVRQSAARVRHTGVTIGGADFLNS
jgi:hypothetical protein